MLHVCFGGRCWADQIHDNTNVTWYLSAAAGPDSAASQEDQQLLVTSEQRMSGCLPCGKGQDCILARRGGECEVMRPHGCWVQGGLSQKCGGTREPGWNVPCYRTWPLSPPSEELPFHIRAAGKQLSDTGLGLPQFPPSAKHKMIDSPRP